MSGNILCFAAASMRTRLDCKSTARCQRCCCCCCCCSVPVAPNHPVVPATVLAEERARRELALASPLQRGCPEMQNMANEDKGAAIEDGEAAAAAAAAVSVESILIQMIQDYQGQFAL